MLVRENFLPVSRAGRSYLSGDFSCEAKHPKIRQGLLSNTTWILK